MAEHRASGAATPGVVGNDAAAAEPVDPYVGRVIQDRYRILDRLGEGGMGLVFRGEHILMKKPVAIKLLHRELGSVDDAAKRFEREAQSASRLSHSSIVAVTDFGRTEAGELFLVMEYVPGDHLGAFLERRGRLAPLQALMITRLVLRGLAHAHQAGVVHRDLKPANIMLVERDKHPERIEGVKILDFGIAKMTEATAGTPDVALTRGGMIFGTPSYMSPEQATGEQVDHRTDLYACGVMLYEMLAGRKPFVADDLVKVMAQQVTAPPPPFAKVAPTANVHPALEALVMKALEKERARRFDSARTFLAAVDEAEQALEAGHATTMSVSPWTRVTDDWVPRLKATWKAPKSRRVLLGVLATLVLLALVPALFGKAKIKPAPVKQEVRLPLKQAETAIAEGRVSEAKLILLQQLSKHPDAPRVHFLLGTIAFSEGDADAGLKRYQDAVKLDRGLRADAALLFNVKGLLADRQRAEAALAFLADDVGEPAADVFVQMANQDVRPGFRARAREACERQGCLKKVDLVSSYELDLRQAKTCDGKRAAVVGLGATNDERAIVILKKARRNRSGTLGRWLGVGGGNDCVRSDIDEALKSLGDS